MQTHLPVLYFTEIQNLVYQPAKNPYVLVGDFHQSVLLLREIGGGGELGHRLGNQGERSAQVVGDVGEEHQLLVALKLEHAVLLEKQLLMILMLPEHPQHKEYDPEKKYYDGDTCVKERCL